MPTQLVQVKGTTAYAPTFGVFEVGRVADGVDENGLAKEYKKLCITLFSKVESVETLYFRLRDMLAVTVDDLKHKPINWVKAEATHSWQHPKNLNDVVCDGVVLGQIGVAHPVVAKKIDKKAAIVYAEIDIDALSHVGAERIKYVEPSRFPGMEQDLTFICDKYAPIKEAIEAANSPLVNKVAVVGTYTDDAGKSITVRIFFSHDERTLTRVEVQSVVDGVIANLEKQGIMLKK